ncbi:hypothetical protein [Chromobacterium phragmitis]|uniref:hypothetical protein n=1 Tax=Chromobacterium phragmitis TaxID=2202141 RepID=UPI0032644AD0
MDLSSLLASFASAFNQNQRLLTLELGGGHVAAQQLVPLSLDGEEGVSQAYRHVVRGTGYHGLASPPMLTRGFFRQIVSLLINEIADTIHSHRKSITTTHQAEPIWKT